MGFVDEIYREMGNRKGLSAERERSLHGNSLSSVEFARQPSPSGSKISILLTLAPLR
jgi:hypothetical protein